MVRILMDTWFVDGSLFTVKRTLLVHYGSVRTTARRKRLPNGCLLSKTLWLNLRTYLMECVFIITRVCQLSNR